MNRLNRDVFHNGAVIVTLTHNGTKHCPFPSQSIRFDTELDKYASIFASTHKTNARMSLDYNFHKKLFFKWQIFTLDFDRVIFTDTDVDPYLGTSYSSVQFQRARKHVRLMPKGMMYGYSDHESPVNTGILVVRPNVTLYELGKQVIKRCKFNVTHGFDLQGPPRNTMLGNPYTANTMCIKNNTWEFVGGDSDQGLFSHMMFVQRELSVTYPLYMTSNHFWGGNKPFSHQSCSAYNAHVRNTLPSNHSCIGMLGDNVHPHCFWNHHTRLLR